MTNICSKQLRIGLCGLRIDVVTAVEGIHDQVRHFFAKLRSSCIGHHVYMKDSDLQNNCKTKMMCV